MRKSQFLSLIGILVFVVAGTAQAGLKPAQAKAKADSEKQLSLALAEMNKECGSSATAEINFATWGGEWAKWVSDKPGQICGHALGGIKQLCHDAAYKSAVAENIKKISCSCDGTADAPTKNFSYSGGHFQFKMNVKHDNNAMLEAQHYIANELNK